MYPEESDPPAAAPTWYARNAAYKAMAAIAAKRAIDCDADVVAGFKEANKCLLAFGGFQPWFVRFC